MNTDITTTTTTNTTLTRENFVTNVQKWAILDTQLKIVNEKIKKMREMKHDLTREICDYMNDTNTSPNNIIGTAGYIVRGSTTLTSNSTPDGRANLNVRECKPIKISDGELRLYEKHEYKPLSYGYIQECLENIIKNEDHIEYIMQYLKENREVKTSMDIKRVYNKKT